MEKPTNRHLISKTNRQFWRARDIHKLGKFKNNFTVVSTVMKLYFEFMWYLILHEAMGFKFPNKLGLIKIVKKQKMLNDGRTI